MGDKIITFDSYVSDMEGRNYAIESAIDMSIDVHSHSPAQPLITHCQEYVPLDGNGTAGDLPVGMLRGLVESTMRQQHLEFKQTLDRWELRQEDVVRRLEKMLPHLMDKLIILDAGATVKASKPLQFGTPDHSNNFVKMVKPASEPVFDGRINKSHVSVEREGTNDSNKSSSGGPASNRAAKPEPVSPAHGDRFSTVPDPDKLEARGTTNSMQEATGLIAAETRMGKRSLRSQRSQESNDKFAETSQPIEPISTKMTTATTVTSLVDNDRWKVKTGKSTVKNREGMQVDVDNLVDEESDVSGWRLCLQRVLVHWLFSLASSVTIFCYAVLIALETDAIARDPDMESFPIKFSHYVFTVIFASELLMRCLAYKWQAWCGPDAFWNRLDAVLIISGISEIFLENALGGVKTAGSVMRGVRIARVIRTVRLIRTFRQFHDFQKMAYALISSFRTLICSLALLIFVMFFFGVWLTQSCADLEMREQITDLDLRYGDLIKTMYTLFLSASNGIGWDSCFMPLHNLSWFAGQVFVLYIIIVLFGVLNVVTSVFVESVIRSVQHYKDIIVQDNEQDKNIAVAHMREVFRQVDRDGSGYVSIDELEYFLQEPELRRYMEALSIETEDTRLLFRLLDDDDSGEISVDEFCNGCLKLKGAAKSMDVHILTWRLSNFLDRWADFTGYVEERLSHIGNKVK